MTTTKQYDLLNRLLSISSVGSTGGSPVAVDGSSTASFAYLYNDANQRVRVTQSDGTYWLYEYDKLGQLTSGKHYWSDNTPIAGQQYEYGYDDIGNRTSTKQGGDERGAGLRPAAYSANSLNQYTSRDVPGAADIIGIAHPNASVTVNGAAPYRKGEYFWKELSINNTSAPVWQGVTNIASLSGTNQTNTGNLFLPKTGETFGYDADGNLTNDGHWSYTWDAENRLLSLTAPSAIPTGARQALAFSYDSNWRRVSKVVSNWTGSAWSKILDQRFVYNGWSLVAELNATNNAIIRSYLWSQTASGIGGLVALNDASTGTYFVGYDGNGNAMALIRALDGTVSGKYDHDPFGQPVRVSGTAVSSNPIRFSSKYLDEECGTYYYGYRFLKVDSGRWLSPDPIGERGGQNRYAFTGNSPIERFDKLGLRTSRLSIVVKSFIQDIGETPGTPPEDANLENWNTLWRATHDNFKENPGSDMQDRVYRLFSKRTFRVTCCRGVLTAVSPDGPVATDVGLEGQPPLAFTPPPMVVSGVIDPTVSVPAFGWFAKGRPNNTAEQLFQAVKGRKSKDIWHSIGGLISCDLSGNPRATAILHGSAFPSHRSWINGTQDGNIPQGPFNSLWISDPNNEELVQ